MKLLSRLRKTASLAPAAQGRPRGGGKLAKHRGFLIARVEQQPDITMPELAAALEAAAAGRASPASLSRFLCKAGFTYKKTLPAAEQERAEVRQARKVWILRRHPRMRSKRCFERTLFLR